MRVASRQSPVASEMRGVVPLPLRERQDFLSEQSEVRKSGEGAQSLADTLHAPSPNPLPQGERASPVAPFIRYNNDNNLLVTGDWRLATAR